MTNARPAAMRPASRPHPALLAIGILAVLIVAFLGFSAFWTENLWFASLGFQDVFSIQIITRVLLFVGAALLMGGAVWFNMWLGWRLRPRSGGRGASALLDRYRELLEGNLRTAMLVPSVLLGLMAGMSASTHVLPVLAWLNRVPSGKVDPTFGLDVSFYLFEYPVWRLITATLMSALVFGLLAALALHFTVGSLGAGRPRLTSRVPNGVVKHVSILGALIVGLYGIENLLDRYGLLLSNGTLYTGLHYTDANSRMNALLIMAVISFIVAALFVANAFVNRLFVPAAGLVLMIVSGLVLSMIYPTAIQAFAVRPNEPDRERPFITSHIAMTRDAYAINDVETKEYAAVTRVEPGQLKEDAAALPGIRLMDPEMIGPTFEQLQQVRGYYAFPKVLDVDRYTIDGKETDTVVAAREMNQAGIPDRNWNNIHTVYTHGHGLAVAYGNRRQTAGEPVWIDRDIPPVGKIKQEQSRIYFGEESDTFAIVGRPEGAGPIELDSPGGGSGGGEQYRTYTGQGGVGVGNMMMRAMFAARFSDVNILLSDRVNAESKILYDRTPKERVKKAAPWLTVDQNLYPAIVKGRLVWIVDAYTTSNTYPNSQRVSLAAVTNDSQTELIGAQIDTDLNYIRNSVKATVDAYDGTVTLYAWDEADPVMQSYAKAFPGTVHPKSEISAELLDHLRYPEDLFKVQRHMLGRYHMTNPDAWYQQSDLWEVPVDPVKGQRTAKERPYYLSIKWPGDANPTFSQTSVFVPRLRQNLASYLAVNADAAHADYGKLRVLRMSDTHQIDGPGQTFNAITTDQKVSERLRPFLNQGSASATYGNLLTLPMGNGLLYVLPIYTERTGNAGSYPALTFVVVRFGQHVGIGNTLQEALDAVFQGDAGGNTGEGTTPPSTPTPGGTPTTPAPGGTPTTGPANEQKTVTALQKAEKAFTDADAAMKRGDLAAYQAKTNEAKAAVQEALRAMGR